MRRAVAIIFLFMCFTTGVSFAQEEVPRLVVTNSSAWPPFSFLNEDGEPRGLLIDLWNEFGVRNNVAIEFRLVSWEESLNLVRRGVADVHGGLYESGERQEYLDFIDKLKVPLAARLFVSSKLDVKRVKDLGAIGVGLTEKSFSQEYLATKYPSLHVIAYPGAEEVIQAAVNGDIVAFADDYPTTMYYLHKYGDPGDFHSVEILFEKHLQIAVKAGKPDLLYFISDGFNKIPKEEIDRITQKWVYSVETMPDWLYEFLVGGFFALVAVFGVIHIIGLRQQVRQRTRELEKLSRTDMLTGLNNRMRIEDMLEREMYRASRYKKPLSLIMVDIDYFKQINDTFGHAVGDKVLVEFAEILRNNVRKSDSVGRWGGEEFLIVCPETDERSVVALAEKLRVFLESYEFETVKKCTASFGVTQVRDDDDARKSFERADMALYKSKVDGRNRVTVGE